MSETIGGTAADLPPVRLAAEADMPSIVQVYVRAYAQPPWHEQNDAARSADYLRWLLAQPGCRCLVTGEPGAATGFIFVSPRSYQAFVEDWERLVDRPAAGWPVIAGRLGYVWELAVDPAAPRRGRGSALLAAGITRLREQGCTAVVLRSSERAAPAMALYRTFGFQRLPLRERRDPLAGPWVLRLE